MIMFRVCPVGSGQALVLSPSGTGFYRRAVNRRLNVEFVLPIPGGGICQRVAHCAADVHYLAVIVSFF